MSASLPDVIKIYEGSDGEATSAFYARLRSIDAAIGPLAVDLFRAQKNSERAKEYRGRRYRGAAYDRKQWSMLNITTALICYAEAAGIRWGWGSDDAQPVYKHVLYVDLPTGQVSFHTGERGEGPDYPGAWDGFKYASADRILRWIARLLDAREAA